MRFAIFTLVILMMASSLGCLSSSTSSVTWSKNLAVFASSRDSKFHDDNYFSEGETTPVMADPKDPNSYEEADKFSQALLEWGRPQEIQRVIIKAREGELEFFEIQYQDDAGKWHTVRSVKNNLRIEYKADLKEPIHTRKLRLKIPRAWDSRRVGGEKRRSRGEGGAPAGRYRKIQEIEVYHALPPEEPAVSEESATSQ
jgi:hypothetical protein